ncbi:nuclear body protein SP140-like protein [Anguilla anguilla]|uniref:nuclear body protein SP140-like protein n=1 Tax=Anguilla anguilla TaxID=7936 RepID=UPI0015AA98AD|nr:nuclear body protein SP140-like protein [Anguilla anguilla]XP_035255140.1 nuclear body protein SP140-like protein [Anguilla anguilla]
MYKNSGSKKRSESVEEEEEVAGPSTRSTPSKSKKGSPISKGMHKNVLPVTCGNKNGRLHRDKFAKGEKCILAEGRWFTPSTFEKFGGKKSSKRWKMSIRCQDTPLQKLIEVRESEDGGVHC